MEDNKEFVKFVCISDTHTKHKELKIPDADVLIHAGDFTYKGKEQELKDFYKFLKELPHKHKVVIAGNHDLTLDIGNYQTVTKRFLGDKYSFEQCK